MLHWLLDPLTYEFMRNAVLIGVLVGVLCPVVGCLLMVQQMSLLGDVIAHCVLPGLSVAVFAGVDRTLGAFISGLLGTLFISWIKLQSRIKADAAMALTFSSFFALGVLLISVLKNPVDLDSLLFGDILGVTRSDIWRTLATVIAILLTIALVYKELLFFCFDRVGAQAMGLPTQAIYIGMMIATTLTIIASMQAVGVVLVIALMIAPALSAYLLVKELHYMMLVGAGVGAFVTSAGIYLSYYLNLPSGPAIVLVATSLFIVILLTQSVRGTLSDI